MSERNLGWLIAWVLVGLCVLLFAPARALAPEAPEWVTRELRAPGVSYHTFESPSAGGRVSVHVLTPEAAAKDTDARYPVLYWLHGSSGGLAGIPSVAERFTRAMREGLVPPMYVVFVNGLPLGMYVDWKDGSVKVESMIVRDLVPWIDRTFRTRAGREGRILEGFSMGGYGAARLGFAHADLFGAVSMIGAGPLQDDLLDAPRAGRERAQRILSTVYGNDPEFFKQVSPRALATRNTQALKGRMALRMIVGTRDETFAANEALHRDLERLGLAHAWHALKDVPHDMPAVFDAMGEGFFAFHREFLGVKPQPRDGTIKFTVKGTERQAIVVNAPPADGKDDDKRAVVLVLHGGGGSAEQLRRGTGFDAVARREGFMVVYPQGTEFSRGRHAWNTGYLMRRSVGTVDDIAYFDALIDRLIEKHGADPARAYMTGASNGGMMTFVYACKRAERLAGIAPIVGAMFTFDELPARPVPTLMIVGAKDDEVPIEGGMSRNVLVRRAQEAPYKPVTETLAFWAKANRAASEATIEKQGTLTITTHAATGEGSAVARLVLDAEGGHGWPGTPARRNVAPPIQSFKGAEFVWTFFKEHANATKPAEKPAEKSDAKSAE